MPVPLIERRDLTIEDLHSMVGCPLEPGVAVLRRNGDILEAAWETRLCGAAGWAWSVSRGPRILSTGWRSGNRRDRDAEIRRAVAEHRAGCAS